MQKFNIKTFILVSLIRLCLHQPSWLSILANRDGSVRVSCVPLRNFRHKTGIDHSKLAKLNDENTLDRRSGGNPTKNMEFMLMWVHHFSLATPPFLDNCWVEGFPDQKYV